MEVLQNRIDSFSKPKRVKNPSKPSSSVSLKWPHPKTFAAIPETLAEAGFYYSPSFEDRDNVSCFVCDKQLSDWEAEDDPFDIHWRKCGDSCCWASIRCGLRKDLDDNDRFVFTDKTRLPTSKNMEKARLETFSVGKGWIHDNVKNHGANSRKMALAGFVYTPQAVDDDLATCLYCNTSLSGWDAEDDPMEEHRKRGQRLGTSCPFFSSLEAVAKPSSRAQSRSKYKETTVLTKTPDEDSNEESEPAPRTRQSKSTSNAKTSRKVTRSKPKSELDDVEEDEEVGPKPEPPTKSGRQRRATAAPSRQTSRTKSKSVARTVVEEEEEVVKKAPRTRTTKGKSTKSRAIEEEEEELPELTVEEGGDGEDGSVLKKALKTRAKSKATKSRAVKEERGDLETPAEGEEVVPRKSSKSKAKGKTAKSKSVDEPEKVESIASKSSSKTAKKKDREEMDVPVAESEDMTDGSEPTERKSAWAKSKAKPVPRTDDDNDDELALNPSVDLPRPAPSQSSEERFRSISPADNGEIEQEHEGDSAPSSGIRPTSVLKKRAKPTSKTLGRPPPKSSNKPLSAQKIRIIESNDVDQGNEALLESEVSPPSGQGRREASPAAVKELSPLFIPKRTLKTNITADDVQPPSGGSTDTAKDNAMHVSPPPPSVNVVEQTSRMQKPASKTRKPSSQIRGTAKTVKTKKSEATRKDLKVVEISDDEDAMQVDGRQQEQQDAKSVASASPDPPLAPEPMPEKLSEQPEGPVPTASPLRPLDIPPSPRKPLEHDLKEDAEMAHVEDAVVVQVTQPEGDSRPPYDEPKTPPRKTPPSDLPSQPESNNAPAPPPALIFPALSKLPFTPSQSLTDAELDMTVEEWIRYQMGVEYDKFKRDGERELARFKERANEVRKIIEAL